MHRNRDPTSSAEVVRRLNVPWWIDDHGATEAAFCEALAFIDTELADLLADAVRRFTTSSWSNGIVVREGVPLRTWVAQNGGTYDIPVDSAVPNGASVRSSRINAEVCKAGGASAAKTAYDIKTHSSPHHHDDALAVVLCMYAEASNGVGSTSGKPHAIVRARDESVVAKWTVDVDGKYDPEKRMFDHHQHDHRLANHSASSLVWASHGRNICEWWCRSCGLAPCWANAPGWAALVTEVHQSASSYVQYACDVDNNQVHYNVMWPDPPHPVCTDALTQSMLQTCVQHIAGSLKGAQQRRVVSELAAAVKRVRQAESEQIVAFSGVTGQPYADDYGAVGRHRRGRADRTFEELMRQVAADASHEAEAEKIVQDALEKSETKPPTTLLLSRGTKDLEKLVLRACSSVRFVSWPNGSGYTVKGLCGALLPSWWWNPPDMAKAVKYNVSPQRGADAGLCALVGLPDVRFVHKSGWICSVGSEKSAVIAMRQAAATAASLEVPQ